MGKKGKWYNLALPISWIDVIVRMVMVFIISFLTFHVKEYVDAGMFDTLDIIVDSIWLAGGSLIINAVLLIIKR